jgi:hypothetical protein
VKGAGLPVDPERLKAQFPELSGEDLAAYADVTRRVLADPAAKGRIMREVLDLARAAREKQAGGQGLSAAESLALRYLAAVEKMQRRLA